MNLRFLVCSPVVHFATSTHGLCLLHFHPSFAVVTYREVAWIFRWDETIVWSPLHTMTTCLTAERACTRHSERLSNSSLHLEVEFLRGGLVQRRHIQRPRLSVASTC